MAEKLHSSFSTQLLYTIFCLGENILCTAAHVVLLIKGNLASYERRTDKGVKRKFAKLCENKTYFNQ